MRDEEEELIAALPIEEEPIVQPERISDDKGGAEGNCQENSPTDNRTRGPADDEYASVKSFDELVDEEQNARLGEYLPEERSVLASVSAEPGEEVAQEQLREFPQEQSRVFLSGKTIEFPKTTSVERSTMVPSDDSMQRMLQEEPLGQGTTNELTNEVEPSQFFQVPTIVSNAGGGHIDGKTAELKASSDDPVNPIGRITTYKVIDATGSSGAQGTVYKCVAEDNANNVVAIKTLTLDKNQIERLEKNFELIDSLNQDNICKTRDRRIDKASGKYLLIMEWIDGWELQKWKKKIVEEEGSFSLEKLLPVIRQCAEALDYVHSKEVIHKDIKSGNIMVDKSGVVKLLDFGLADYVAGEKGGEAIGNFGGTPTYMPPEQLEVFCNPKIAYDSKVSPYSDQYSLAVVIYEMLSGRNPFGRVARNLDKAAFYKQLLDYQRNWKYVPIPDVPRKVNNALKKALNPDQNKRFATCMEMYHAMTMKVTESIAFRAWIVAAVFLLLVFGGVELWRKYGPKPKNSPALQVLQDQAAVLENELNQSRKMFEWKGFDKTEVASTIELIIGNREKDERGFTGGYIGGLRKKYTTGMADTVTEFIDDIRPILAARNSVLNSDGFMQAKESLKVLEGRWKDYDYPPGASYAKNWGRYQEANTIWQNFENEFERADELAGMVYKPASPDALEDAPQELYIDGYRVMVDENGNIPSLNEITRIKLETEEFFGKEVRRQLERLNTTLLTFRDQISLSENVDDFARLLNGKTTELKNQRLDSPEARELFSIKFKGIGLSSELVVLFEGMEVMEKWEELRESVSGAIEGVNNALKSGETFAALAEAEKQSQLLDKGITGLLGFLRELQERQREILKARAKAAAKGSRDKVKTLRGEIELEDENGLLEEELRNQYEIKKKLDELDARNTSAEKLLADEKFDDARKEWDDLLAQYETLRDRVTPLLGDIKKLKDERARELDKATAQQKHLEPGIQKYALQELRGDFDAATTLFADAKKLIVAAEDQNDGQNSKRLRDAKRKLNVILVHLEKQQWIWQQLERIVEGKALVDAQDSVALETLLPAIETTFKGMEYAELKKHKDALQKEMEQIKANLNAVNGLLNECEELLKAYSVFGVLPADFDLQTIRQQLAEKKIKEVLGEAKGLKKRMLAWGAGQLKDQRDKWREELSANETELGKNSFAKSFGALQNSCKGLLTEIGKMEAVAEVERMTALCASVKDLQEKIGAFRTEFGEFARLQQESEKALEHYGENKKGDDNLSEEDKNTYMPKAITKKEDEAKKLYQEGKFAEAKKSWEELCKEFETFTHDCGEALVARATFAETIKKLDGALENADSYKPEAIKNKEAEAAKQLEARAFVKAKETWKKLGEEFTAYAQERDAALKARETYEAMKKRLDEGLEDAESYKPKKIMDKETDAVDYLKAKDYAIAKAIWDVLGKEYVMYANERKAALAAREVFEVTKNEIDIDNLDEVELINFKKQKFGEKEAEANNLLKQQKKYVDAKKAWEELDNSFRKFLETITPKKELVVRMREEADTALKTIGDSFEDEAQCIRQLLAKAPLEATIHSLLRGDEAEDWQAKAEQLLGLGAEALANEKLRNAKKFLKNANELIAELKSLRKREEIIRKGNEALNVQDCDSLQECLVELDDFNKSTKVPEPQQKRMKILQDELQKLQTINDEKEKLLTRCLGLNEKFREMGLTLDERPLDEGFAKEIDAARKERIREAHKKLFEQLDTMKKAGHLAISSGLEVMKKALMGAFSKEDMKLEPFAGMFDTLQDEVKMLQGKKVSDEKALINLCKDYQGVKEKFEAFRKRYEEFSTAREELKAAREQCEKALENFNADALKHDIEAYDAVRRPSSQPERELLTKGETELHAKWLSGLDALAALQQARGFAEEENYEKLATTLATVKKGKLPQNKEIEELNTLNTTAQALLKRQNDFDVTTMKLCDELLALKPTSKKAASIKLECEVEDLARQTKSAGALKPSQDNYYEEWSKIVARVEKLLERTHLPQRLKDRLQELLDVANKALEAAGTRRIQLDKNNVLEMVRIPKAVQSGGDLWISRNKVTQGQYNAFLATVSIPRVYKGYFEEKNKSWFGRGKKDGANQMGKVNTTWDQAWNWCDLMNQNKEIKKVFEQDFAKGYQFRLPTEAEWKRCALLDNALAPKDMLTGVSEWCLDDESSKSGDPIRRPQLGIVHTNSKPKVKTTQIMRVIKGGSKYPDIEKSDTGSAGYYKETPSTGEGLGKGGGGVTTVQGNSSYGFRVILAPAVTYTNK